MAEEFIFNNNERVENQKIEGEFSSLFHHLGTFTTSLKIEGEFERVGSSTQRHLAEAKRFANQLIADSKNPRLVSSLEILNGILNNIDNNVRPNTMTLDQLNEALDEAGKEQKY